MPGPYDAAVTAIAIVLAVVAGLALLGLALALRALRRATTRLASLETEIERGKGVFDGIVQRELSARADELANTLARARADSISLLAEEERRHAEERRALVAQREREATATLSEALTAAQARIDQRVATWAADLERTQQSLADELRRLSERQKRLLEEMDARIGTDTEALGAASEEQKNALHQLREELAAAARDAAVAAAADIEQHAAERRRALHELNDRLARREQELGEQVSREAGEATERLKTMNDVERRQVEALERVVSRATARYAEEAQQQFEQTARTSREEAARRLARELELAVERFSREAEGVIGERLAQAADAAAAKVEQRLSALRGSLDRQRDELVAALERHTNEAEQTLRERLQMVAADAEAERGVLDARLHELARRIDEAVAKAQDRLDQLAALGSR